MHDDHQDAAINKKEITEYCRRQARLQFLYTSREQIGVSTAADNLENKEDKRLEL